MKTLTILFGAVVGVAASISVGAGIAVAAHGAALLLLDLRLLAVLSR